MSHRLCCVDGLTGFEEAIQTVFPLTLVQLCSAAVGGGVHMVRGSLRFVNWGDRPPHLGGVEAVATDLRAV